MILTMLVQVGVVSVEQVDDGIVQGTSRQNEGDPEVVGLRASSRMSLSSVFMMCDFNAMGL